VIGLQGSSYRKERAMRRPGVHKGAEYAGISSPHRVSQVLDSFAASIERKLRREPTTPTLSDFQRLVTRAMTMQDEPLLRMLWHHASIWSDKVLLTVMSEDPTLLSSECVEGIDAGIDAA
jgi:hypothetical protein